MKNPNTMNLLTSDHVRALGWQAETRDVDGHLCRTHRSFETDEEIVWLVREALEHGETITIWPKSSAAPPQTNMTVADYATRLFDLHGFMLLETYRGKHAVTVTFPDLKEAQQFHNTLVELSQHRATTEGSADA